MNPPKVPALRLRTPILKMRFRPATSTLSIAASLKGLRVSDVPQFIEALESFADQLRSYAEQR